MSKPALQQIYKGKFADRVPHFDDGGYVNYASVPSNDTQLTYNPDTMTTSAPTVTLNAADTAGAGSGSMTGGNIATTGDVGTVMNGNLVAGSENGSGGYTGSSGSSTSSGALSSILKSLGLGGGNTSNTAALSALTGLLGAAGTYKQNQAAAKLPSMPAMGALPALPGTSSTGYGPAGGYNFSNYSGSSGAPPGLGYAPKTASNAPARNSYFTYGSGPEQQFFQQVTPGGGPIAPVTQAAKGGHISMARGGAVPHFDMGGMVPNVGGQQSVLGQGAMAQPGQTPMTPRPMMGAPAPAAPMTQAAAPPAAPRPPMPAPGAPRPPMAPPSTMMQRMQAARPPHMADGGSTSDSPGFAPGQTPMISPQQMAQSQSIQTQNPRTLANVPRRGVGVSGARPGGNMPVVQQRADGGLSDGQGALSAVGQSRHITGPGDGTSDSIPARLASGEYVIDAQAVSMLGNGDNSAGAKRLDEFRKSLRAHKGAALAKGRMAPNAKPIHKYMGGQ